MDENLDQQYWINWIISDYMPFENYFIASPSRENRFIAEEIYLKYYKQALEAGCLSEEDLFKILFKRKIWSQVKEIRLKELEKDMDNIKIKMYECFLNADLIKKLKIQLNDIRKSIENLNKDKSSFDGYTAKALAGYAKQNFLLGSSIYCGKNKPYWKSPKCFSLSDSILPKAYEAISDYQLDDEDYRELARGSIWRSIWSIRKGAGNIFGRSLVDLTAAQRNLLAWSNLYENVYSHSEAPPDEVIEDDDILDGWMLFQKRKREIESGKNEIMSRINPKIAQADEVFIMMGNESSIVGKDKFDLVYNMNDITGKIAFKKRMAQIQREGVVPDIQMKETQEQLQMQLAKAK